jgi:hypothetical protein
MKASLSFLIVAAVAGCDSLVGDPCSSGFSPSGGACDAPDAGVGTIGTPVGPTPSGSGSAGSGSAMTCSTDVSSDPINCGACGVVCQSGVCDSGTCAGAIVGHAIAIGHDYTSYDGAMVQVLANAAGLGAHTNIGVAVYHGTATAPSHAGTAAAFEAGLQRMGRNWHAVAVANPPTPAQLAGADVVLVEAQLGDPAVARAAGARWQAALSGFVTGGGVVVVLEGEEGVSYQFAAGAGLYDVGAPVAVTGQLATVVTAADATTSDVVSPYMAMSTSVAYPTATGATITTAAGGVVYDYPANAP